MRIEIEKLIYEGWGIGRQESGRPVFVRKSVPGDILEVEITKHKKTYDEAIIKKIIKPSALRVEPPCKVFDLCGGCEHQNIAYPDQLKLKEAVFREVLARNHIETEILPIVQASEPFYYRNSIRFGFIFDKDGKIHTARHNYLYDEGLITAEKCLLQSETANEIIGKFEEFVNENVEDRAGFWQLKIREGKGTGEFMIEIITTSHDLPAKQGIIQILTKIAGVKSIYHTIAPAKSLRNLERHLVFGSPIIYEKIGKFSFQISPDSFFQTNSLGVKNLYDKIKEFVDVRMGESVLDLYCGTGSIGIYLSTLAKKVIGVEVVQSAINDAKANAKINKVSNCEFICADATRWLKSHSHSCESRNLKIPDRVRDDIFDKIIVDPPRAGLSKEIICQIAKLKIENLVYVSCNPATFARDIKLFETFGLKLKKVQPLDMFPQTHHIECVGLLSR